MPPEDQKTEAKIPGVQALSVADGSASEHVKARFIIVQRPGKIPTKKGPLKREMVTEYLRSLRKHFPESTLTVAEIAVGSDLWLTCESEWLQIEELNALPNAEVSDRRAHAPKSTTGANGGSLY